MQNMPLARKKWMSLRQMIYKTSPNKISPKDSNRQLQFNISKLNSENSLSPYQNSNIKKIDFQVKNTFKISDNKIYNDYKNLE